MIHIKQQEHGLNLHNDTRLLDDIYIPTINGLRLTS